MHLKQMNEKHEGPTFIYAWPTLESQYTRIVFKGGPSCFFLKTLYFHTNQIIQIHTKSPPLEILWFSHQIELRVAEKCLL